MANEKLSQLWSSLSSKRTASLKRGRELSAMTLPVVCPPEGVLPDQVTNDVGYSSFCSAGVSGLVTKLQASLFPHGRSFFRLTTDDEGMDAMAAEIDGDRNDASKFLAAQEKDAATLWDKKGESSMIPAVLEQLCITGNALVYEDDINGATRYRCIGLQDFVLDRTVSGAITTVIIRDTVAWGQLDEKVHDKLKAERIPESDTMTMYTAWEMDSMNKGKITYKERQEIADVEVFRSKKAESEDDVRWFFVGGRRAPKAVYCLPLLYPHLEDIKLHRKYSKEIGESGVKALFLQWIVSEGSMSPDTLSRLMRGRNGDVFQVSANSSGVHPLDNGMMEKVIKAQQLVSTIEQRLSKAFLQTVDFLQANMQQSTATEIRTIVGELSRIYSGVHNELAQTLQLPLAKRLLKDADAKVDGTFEVKIVTGLEAFARDGELESLQQWMTTMGQLIQLDQATGNRLDLDQLNRIVTAACGSPTQTVFRSPSNDGSSAGTPIEQQPQ